MVNGSKGIFTAQDCVFKGLFRLLGATRKIEDNAAMA